MPDVASPPAMEVDQHAKLEDSPSAPIEEDRKPELEQPPVKRQRTVDSKTEDRKRGQRLMGNLLGTLAKFKGEEKTRGSTDRARKRDEVSQRIASKIQSETQLNNEIHSLEKDIKTCRFEIERKEVELKQRQLAIRTRARQLPRVSHLLLTSSTSWKSTSAPLALPNGFPPSRDKQSAEIPKPLYYRPKRLLREQRETLEEQQARVEEILRKEDAELEDLRVVTEEAVSELRKRLEIASADLAQRKPRTKASAMPADEHVGRRADPRSASTGVREIDMDVDSELAPVADDAEVEY